MPLAQSNSIWGGEAMSNHVLGRGRGRERETLKQTPH